MNRNLELIASLAVPVPGFPVAQFNWRSRPPSGETWRSHALILTGPTAEDFEPELEMTRTEYLRRRHALAASVQ